MTAATARAGVARRTGRRVRRVSIDRFLLSTPVTPLLHASHALLALLAFPLALRPARPRVRRTFYASLSLSLSLFLYLYSFYDAPSSTIFLASFPLSVTVLSFPPAPSLSQPFFSAVPSLTVSSSEPNPDNLQRDA